MTFKKGHETNVGRKLSEAHKKAISDFAKTRTGEANPFFGRTHSEETKRKISEKGKKRCKSTYARPMLGKKHTEETKRKISESKKGRVPWNKGRGQAAHECRGCHITFMCRVAEGRKYCSHTCYMENYGRERARRMGQWRKHATLAARNKEKARKARQVYREKLRHDAQYRINSAMSGGIRGSLRGKKHGRSWESLVGYTLADLMQYLENQFEEWMTWDNYGEWHIDHIRPKSSFTYSNTEDAEFKECWALENLQPLGATENLKKGSKW